MLMQLNMERANEFVKAANDRQDYAERFRLENYDGRPMTAEQEREAHGVGALGEGAAADLFGLKFDPAVGVLDGTDLKIIEVRARRAGGSGGDLAMRRGDNEKAKLRRPFLLVHVNPPKLTVQFIGWLCGWEAWERRSEENCHYGVWYIRPPYHSVLSLQQWVQCGHRLHWSPPEYESGRWKPSSGKP